MVQIRCTKKVYDLLGIKSDQLYPCKETEAILGNWYTNVFSIERRKALIFMSERTLFSFILLGVRKNNIKKIGEAFCAGLKQLLEIEGFRDTEISLLLSDCQHIELTKTNSPVLLGNLNDLVMQYKYTIYHFGGLSYSDITSITKDINRIPQKNLNWSTPFDKVMESIRHVI